MRRSKGWKDRGWSAGSDSAGRAQARAAFNASFAIPSNRAVSCENMCATWLVGQRRRGFHPPDAEARLKWISAGGGRFTLAHRHRKNGAIYPKGCFVMPRHGVRFLLRLLGRPVSCRGANRRRVLSRGEAAGGRAMARGEADSRRSGRGEGWVGSRPEGDDGVKLELR